MIPTMLSVLLTLNSTQSLNQPDPFRGTQESVAPKLNHSSGGMTLEALHGLPLTRPVYAPPQPQVWIYQPYIGGYSRSPGMGGYLPPGTGRSYGALGFGWWW
ncbi:hypothetical protein [Frigoriglobus tundricola]|uniref:Uncharacterized protein n=1 Tax=Frigoriglobus tundricola TaxID=2774151 RepID=A0A6M5YNE9_9BACT|nr:hypothetical protein [Frigoriglobus tundricola]QJW94771.1 hypothetical protein FTUN_2294 [Frigoriglobus tundricola]